MLRDAERAKAFYDECKKIGFSSDEAFELTKIYLTAMYS